MVAALLRVTAVPLLAAVFAMMPSGEGPPPAAPGKAAALAFERFRSLAGNWEGTSTKGWRERLRYQVVAGGTALLETSFEAHPGETMATVFALDAGALDLRHYCAAGNHPHLRATRFEDDGRRVTFTFVDGGNLASRDQGHMDQVVFHFEDDDRVTSRWSWYQNGTERWMEEIRLVRKR